ncbi:MAG: leucyl aminopeptidase family protein, partial [Lysobacterales bacterium]
MTSVPLVLTRTASLPQRLAQTDPVTRAWLAAAGFTAAPGSHCLIAASDGRLAAVWVGYEAGADLAALAGLAHTLPPGRYALDPGAEPLDAELAALGFALGAYRFSRYRKAGRDAAELALPNGVDGERLAASIEAVNLARDLINTPSEHLGPAELA